MNVIVVGDSFTFGHGCKDRIYFYDHKLKEYVGTPDFMYKSPSEYCWASLLEQEFKNKIKVVNKAIPGRSMQGMHWDLLQTFRKSEIKDGDIVIFAGTTSNRIEISSKHNAHETSSWGPNWNKHNKLYKDVKFNKAQLLYTKHLWSETICDQQALTAIMSAWALCQVRNIKFFWSMPEGSLYDSGLLRMFRSFATTSEIKSLNNFVSDYKIMKKFRHIDGHANEEGHKLFYNEEIRPLFLKLFEEIKL